MNGQSHPSQQEKSLAKANETFQFWYSVLLETEYMNDLENRKEFQSALMTLKEIMEKQKED
jgi:hypothetical protein